MPFRTMCKGDFIQVHGPATYTLHEILPGGRIKVLIDSESAIGPTQLTNPPAGKVRQPRLQTARQKA